MLTIQSSMCPGRNRSWTSIKFPRNTRTAWITVLAMISTQTIVSPRRAGEGAFADRL